MRDVAIIGLDGTGKSTIANALGRITGDPVIHLTTFDEARSDPARYLGHALRGVTELVDRVGNKQIGGAVAGAAYLGFLLPAFLERKVYDADSRVIFDRHPIIDTLCFADAYLPKGPASRVIRPTLQRALHTFFSPPRHVFYLEGESTLDGRQEQLHENDPFYQNIIEAGYAREMARIGKYGTEVVGINTSNTQGRKSINEITEEILGKL